MVNTSKILTVSYGTFSCTLEGFDDSFETMKAIAEYFRDLAADDRYFGAEPPVPDAEMLARIAEREISRRVEAREEQGNIVLRAAQQGVTPALNAPLVAPVAAQAAAPTAEPTAAPTAEPTAAPSPAPAQPTPQPEQAQAADDTSVTEEPAQPDTTADAPAQPEAEDVLPEDMPIRAARSAGDDSTIAAKLQRIRAVVSRNTAVASDYSEDEHADLYVEQDTATLDTVLDQDAETGADLPTADLPAHEITEPEIEAQPTVEAPEDAPAEAEATEQDATLIAATDAEDETAEVQDTAQAETPAQDDIAQEQPQPEDELQTEDEQTDSAAPAQEPSPEDLSHAAPDVADDDTSEDEDDVAAILDRLAGLSDDPAPAQASAPDTDMPDDDGDADQDMDRLLAELAGPAAVSSETMATDTDEDASDDIALATTQPPLRARVVKMKRADFEAAIAEGQLEETDEDDDTLDDDWSAVDDTTLSPEEEAELQAELAEVAAELEDEDSALADDGLDDGDEIDSIFAEAVDDTPDTGDRRRALDQLEEAASERDMTRLMAKTISEMDEPESTSRRNAIAHLRAAVAATRADKEAGVTERPDTIGDAFRDDLASVVRPRRPRAEGTPTARPADQMRPAPLKLVAEQRVDAPATPAAPVRPRRVSMADIQQETRATPKTEAGNTFADYVEEKGAQDLPEILEAAASFLSFVEGRDQFSRPQLMTRARSVVGDDFSREDGLRSFGQLLRQGKIQKLKGGRFTVSEQIGFQPSERRAG